MGFDIKHEVTAVRHSLESVLKMLGSHDPEKRWEALEILLGITSRAENTLVAFQLNEIAHHLKQAEAGMTNVLEAAHSIKGVAK